LLIATDAFSRALPETVSAMAPALERIAARFGSVADVTLNPEGLEPWMQDFRLIQGSDIWATHQAWIRSLSPDFGGGIRERFKWVSTLTDEQVAPARQRRREITSRLNDLLADGTVLVIPTTPGIAPLRGLPVPELEAWRNRCLGLLCIAGHAGLPQISLPMASLGGCPIGVSLIAASGCDTMLLDMGASLC
jgi:amidase